MWALSKQNWMKTMPKLLGQLQTASVEAKIQLWIDFLFMWYYSVPIENFRFIFGRLVNFHINFQTPH